MFLSIKINSNHLQTELRSFFDELEVVGHDQPIENSLVLKSSQYDSQNIAKASEDLYANAAAFEFLMTSFNWEAFYLKTGLFLSQMLDIVSVPVFLTFVGIIFLTNLNLVLAIHCVCLGVFIRLFMKYVDFCFLGAGTIAAGAHRLIGGGFLLFFISLILLF